MAYRQNDHEISWEKLQEDITTKYGKENLHKFVLNEKNINITESYINSIFEKFDIDHRVRDLSIYYKAMTHISYTRRDLTDPKVFRDVFSYTNNDKNITLTPIVNEASALPLESVDNCYERLEYEGDAVLKNIHSSYLCKRYEKMNPGELTKLRSNIENKSILSVISLYLGLHKYVKLSRKYEINGREHNTKINCDVFEAFIGAMKRDINYNETIELEGVAYSKCYKLVVNALETIPGANIAKLLHTEINYKGELNNYFHKSKWNSMVKYEPVNNINDEDKMYKFVVRNDEGHIIGRGKGHSKANAQKNTAKNVLETLGVINIEEVIEEEIDEKYVIIE